MEDQLQKTNEKLRKFIWAHKTRKHISETDFRAIVQDVTGQRSTGCLTDEQANAIVGRLMNERSRKPTGRAPNRQPAALSSKQLYFIKDLGRRLGLDSDQRLNGMLRKKFRIDDKVRAVSITGLSPGQASKFIEMLRSMVARGWHTSKGTMEKG